MSLKMRKMPDLELNKKNAMAFYELMFTGGQPRKAIAQYVGESYTQHNPHVIEGKDGFIDYFERMARDYPDKSIKFVRAIAEGHLVVLHTHQTWPGEQDYATIDIFRFDAAGKIVEHWDVMQTVPDEMAHANGMF